MRIFWLLGLSLFFPLFLSAQLPSEGVQGYIYVDAFEVRKEFAVHLRSLPEWKEGAEADESLDQAQQAEVLQTFTERFTQASPLEIDGSIPEMSLDRIAFVRVIDPEIGVLPDTRDAIPLSEALVAAVFATATDGFPEELVLDWDFFPEGVEAVPVSFVSPSKRNVFQLTPDSPPQSWTLPEDEKIPTLFQVPPPPAPSEVRIPVLSLILVAIAAVLGIAVRIGKQLPSSVGIASVGCILLAFLTWGTAGVKIQDPYAEEMMMSEQEARKLVLPLLRNIYHAFDYRDESRIYDTLAASVTGDLLETIYLDIRRGLVLEEQGGPQVKVSNVDLREVSMEAIGQREGMRADVEWIALGSVTHWGHVHKRLNKYHAWITIEPIENQWKVTEIEIIEEGRIN